ncbi:MAG: ATP-dependent RNA helicase HrpA [Gammaproteobacteria bacterium]|nr:ATP-dependent RNA helicase HrpA [Gammaproteobacteria bacterium]
MTKATTDIASLRQDLQNCMLKDNFFLSRKLKDKKTDLDRLSASIEASKLRVVERARALPSIEYPEELPVTGRREDIKALIEKHQVIILSGETGSGKTTQIPKICLELGLGVKGLIGHTQPRRIAARTVANRIAEELKTTIGQSVGFKVRFSDHVNELTHIKLMTDGILLAEIQSDRYLLQYEVIIIDEAHERSLNIDFILGYLKIILKKRPDLKVIVTSATIDTEKFSKHFDGAPVIEVSGRTYPVKLLYHPLNEKDENANLQTAISDAIFELTRSAPGDTLVFLPGEREIRETAEYLRKHHPPHTEILPLFSRLSVKDQEKIFKSHQGNRVILSTNVAETSLTVPGIRYVVDSGLARTSRYSIRSRIQRLPIEAISQAAANQRSGRCGRVSSGVCIRLYSEEDYLSRAEFTDPEILRVNLASVILQMLSMRIGDVFDYPFINKPERKHINDGLKLLEELGAVSANQDVTETGRKLAKLPVDPRLGKMLVEADTEGSLKEVLIIVAFLSIQDPRERPFEAQQKADEYHNRFSDPASDFVAALKLWEYAQTQSKQLSQNKFRRLCKTEFLSYMRLREWKDIVVQLKTSLADLNMKVRDQEAGYDAIHRPLLAGLLSNIGFKSEDNEFQGTRQKKFFIFPGSHLQKKPPKWVMASEIVETRRNFGRNAAKIEPEWIVSLAKHIVKRHYFEPHWQKNSGQVSAYEKVTLYGLVIIAKKRVNYGPINPEEAREIFIRKALVEGELKTLPAFLKYNLELVQDVELLEHKSRRPDILISDDELYQFYDEIIPDHVYAEPNFNAWLKKQNSDFIEKLKFSPEQLIRDNAAHVSEEKYPESIMIDGFRFFLKYSFNPGGQNDGLTVVVPLGILSKMQSWWFEWLVAGMLFDKVVALIKSLPKSIRKNFVPVPDFAQAFVNSQMPYQKPLLDSLSYRLSEISGVKVLKSDFDLDKLSPHLLVNYELKGGDGKTLVTDSNIDVLQSKYGELSSAAFSNSPVEDLKQESVTSWSFGALPESKVIESEHGSFTAYPALSYEKGELSLKYFSTTAEANENMPAGLMALLKLTIPNELKSLEKKFFNIDKICLLYAQIGNCQELKAELVSCVVRDAFFSDWEAIRNEAQFKEAIDENLPKLAESARGFCDDLLSALQYFQQCKKLLKKNSSPFYLEALADINEQLSLLIYRHMFKDISRVELSHIPRYLQAVLRRLEKLPSDHLADRKHMLEIKKYVSKYKAQMESNKSGKALRQFRWMIEEYRVSLFAQNLKTAYPISSKRLDIFYRENLTTN